MLYSQERLWTESPNRRTEKRTAIPGRAMLRFQHYKFRPTEVIELSQTGARLVVREPLTPGQLVEVMVRTSGEAFTRWARVAWTSTLPAASSTVVGFCFL